MELKFSPVGFFDSGIGGLSVLKEAARVLPNEDFIYYGDNVNAPYGEKTEEEIRLLTLRCGEFLYEKGVKAMVMACNTATSAAVRQMRELYRMPVVSMEPAVRPAVSGLQNGRVLTLATPVTVNQQRYLDLLKSVGSADRVESIGCPGLSELIETGDFESTKIDAYLYRLLAPFEGREIDGIVLGCTHYSFIREKIGRYALSHFTGRRMLYDGNAGTVRQLRKVLAENGLINDASKSGRISFFSSSGPEAVRRFERIFLSAGNGRSTR